MALVINTPKTPYTDFTTTLSGTTYQLNLRWNGRAESWYLDIATSNGVVIRKGAKLLPKVPLIVKNKSMFPDGNLFVVKSIEGYSEPVGRDNLGKDSPYSLIFLTNQEIEDA